MQIMHYTPVPAMVVHTSPQLYYFPRRRYVINHAPERPPALHHHVPNPHAPGAATSLAQHPEMAYTEPGRMARATASATLRDRKSVV